MNNDIKTIAAKYIAGQADDKEIAMVKQWIAMSKDNEEYYVQLYEVWHDTLSAETNLIDSERAYQLFIEKTSVKASLHRPVLNWWRIAAAAVIMLMCSIGYFYYHQVEKPQTWHSVKVLEGTTRKLVLADGTTVWINAGSHIKYSRDFGKASRTIYLDGEAYFDIAANKKNIPFLVKTKHFTIRDIGTVFNIKAYSDEPSFEATVVEGKISVEGKLSKHDEENSKVFLEKKQVLKINSQADKVTENETTPERIKVLAIEDSQIQLYNGWKDDFLVFEGASFNELAKIIERRYAVEVIFKDEALKAYKYTGSFRNVAKITNVMNIIKATTAISYTITGNKIIISESK